MDAGADAVGMHGITDVGVGSAVRTTPGDAESTASPFVVRTADPTVAHHPAAHETPAIRSAVRDAGGRLSRAGS
jgi:hypothetical protein